MHIFLFIYFYDILVPTLFGGHEMEEFSKTAACLLV